LAAPEDCYSQLNVTLIEKLGADWDTIPDINIVSHNGDTVTFNFKQNIKSIADMLSVHYHVNVHETECKMMLDVDEGFETELTAYCVDDVAAVSIYVYVGNSFVVEDCEACEAPADDATDMVAYYFELPCTSECAPEPDDCYSHVEGKLIETVGAQLDMVPEINIVSHDGDTVTFNFKQNIKSIADMLSVHYHVNLHETECKMMLLQ
jgi:hypothetical protein